MAMQELAGKTIAVLAADGVEEMELVEPKIFLSERGASVNILSPTGAGKQIQAVNFMEIADKFTVDKHVGDADPNDYDLLLIPGGTWSPDFLRVNEDAVEFIKRFSQTGKPIASICHGPWTLIDAGLVRGKKITSVLNIRQDLENAGATWVDQEVVVDGNVITSRTPLDLAAFNEAILKALSTKPSS